MKSLLALLFLLWNFTSSSQVGYGSVDARTMQDLNDTLRKDPANVGLLYIRGMSFLENKVYDSALIDLNKALEYFSRDTANFLIPRKEDIFCGRAETYAAMGRWDSVMSDVSFLQKMQPADYLYSGLHLWLLVKYENFEVAQKEIDKLKAEKKTEERALVWQAELYKATGKNIEALSAIDYALKKYPKSAEGFIKKADLLFEQKRYKEACLYLSKAQAIINLKYYNGDEFYFNTTKQGLKMKKALFCR